jgi:hypothetical protein
MPAILTAAQQEARLLTAELEALDDHDAATDRLLLDPVLALNAGDRAAIRRNLSARVVERARRLAKLVDP